MCAQNDTIHAWYSHSHNACSWLGESGIAWAPGGDLTHSISTDGGQTWGNTTVGAPYYYLSSIVASPKS